jgi:AcrR family transcriptional regulator
MSDQRERLVTAMTAVVGRHGYAEASVARVVKQAGMSRATFYEHFEDREDCFLAAFQRAAAAPVLEQLQAGSGRAAAADRPREVVELLLRAADADPAAARLLLVEAMAGGKEVCAAHEALLLRVEEAIDRYLDGPGRRRLEIPARALLGGIANLVGMRVFRREGPLTGLAEELVAWLESYSLPPGRSRLVQAEWDELGRHWAGLDPEAQPTSVEGVVKRLPRGRSHLRPAAVAGDHRHRIIEAIARCSRQRTYTETTVADIVAAAGVARGAFYEQFRNKEDAYLAAQAFGLEGGAAAAAASFFTDAPWPERIFAAADSLLVYIAERPNLAHMQLVESYRVGPAAIRRSFENRMAFTIFLEDGYRQRPQAEELPRISSEVISGAAEELFRHQVARGQTERAHELAPQAAYVAMAPFLGAEQALEFVREKSRRPA